MEYSILTPWVDVLPANEFSPVYPFGGFVINLNVATRSHRDKGDLCLCLILVISDCEGGSLCLYEPGVVLELKSGDIVLFKSDCLTHFNLHFKGFRSSMVFHSDKEAGAWVHSRNGWKDHVDFRSTYVPTST
jgi:hypothetical protein